MEKSKSRIIPEKEKVSERFDNVSIEEQMQAIDITKERLDDEKLISIKFIYDRFFSILARIERFISNNLIKEKEILPHLSYYLKILNADIVYDNSKEFSMKVHEYLKFYRFESTIKLLNRAKKNLKY